ncbi:hypothetical protein CAter10_2060 [Collimonas arenae]|nr:hypothetical protein CAter10_2060 [Collimonas arenae]
MVLEVSTLKAMGLVLRAMLATTVESRVTATLLLPVCARTGVVTLPEQFTETPLAGTLLLHAACDGAATAPPVNTMITLAISFLRRNNMVKSSVNTQHLRLGC